MANGLRHTRGYVVDMLALSRLTMRGLPLLRGRDALVCLSWYGGLPLVLIHLTIAEFLLRFHRFSTNDCRGSGPRRRCLHSSTVIRRLTSTSGLRHSPLPLLSSMRKWRTFFTDADPTSHRVRLWRGGSASSLFFYLFFYSFVEYVDIVTSTYLKAPGPYCGAEGRWRIVGLTVSASV